MLGVNFNSGTSYAQRALNQHAQQLAQSVERLGAGKRITSAADDAAGLAVATRIEMSMRANAVAQKNVLDGISYAQQAEQALGEVTNSLQRMRELLVQAGGVGSLQDALVPELSQVFSEIDRVLIDTEIFGKNPFSAPDMTINIGVDIEPPPPRFAPDYVPATHVNGQKVVYDLNSVLGGQDSVAFGTSGLEPVAYIPAGSTNVEFEIDTTGAEDDIQLFCFYGEHIGGTRITPEYQTDDNGDYILDGDGNRIVESPASPYWQALGINTPEDLMTVDNGFEPGADYTDVGMVVSTEAAIGGNVQFINGPGNARKVLVGEANENLMIMVTGDSEYLMRAKWDSMPLSGTTPLPYTQEYLDWSARYQALYIEKYNSQLANILVDPNSDSHITIDRTPLDRKSLGLNKLWLANTESISASLGYVDGAIEKATEARVYYGAMQSRLEGALKSQAANDEAMSATRSRIEDADYAAETARMARSQVLQHAATAMVAQANQSPQMILRLLQ